MRIRYFGHSSFLIETNNLKILTDPYDPSLGYKVNFPEVDVVTISHEHFDHNAVKFVPRYSKVLKGEINETIGSTKFESILAYHDTKLGRERGTVNLFKITDDDGVSVVHLSDLGDVKLNEKQTKFLKDVNIFLVPVGGYYTIGPEEADKLIETFKPNIVIPMHYKLKGATLNIKTVDEFLKGKKFERLEELDVTSKTLKGNRIVVLEANIK